MVARGIPTPSYAQLTTPASLFPTPKLPGSSLRRAPLDSHGRPLLENQTVPHKVLSRSSSSYPTSSSTSSIRRRCLNSCSKRRWLVFSYHRCWIPLYVDIHNLSSMPASTSASTSTSAVDCAPVSPPAASAGSN